MVATFGVLRPNPVCFIMFEASGRAVVPSCSPECIEFRDWGVGGIKRQAADS